MCGQGMKGWQPILGAWVHPRLQEVVPGPNYFCGCLPILAITRHNDSLTRMTGSVIRHNEPAVTHEYVFRHTCAHTVCCDLSTEGLKGGRPAVSWGGGLFRGVGGWDRQDRLSSLSPFCYGWIGDYSSRCVIRSELYSCGCRVRRRVTRECLGGLAPQESHFTGVKWIYGMCQVVFLPPRHTLTVLVSSPSSPPAVFPWHCKAGRSLKQTHTRVNVQPLATLEM